MIRYETETIEYRETMQAATTAAISDVGTTPRPTDRKATARHNPATTHYGSRRSRNAFLKEPIPSILPRCVTVACRDTNLITRENYEYLRDSYFRYAQLLNVEAPHDPGRDCGDGIAHLYEELAALVGPSLDVNIELLGCDKLTFALWHTHDWAHYNLYWLPVSFVERLRPQFRRLVITFLHELMLSNRLSAISTSDDADYVFEWMREIASETPHEREKRDLKDNILSYESGRAHKLLQRIERRSYYKNLPRALDKYVAQDAAEHALLDIMRDGMQFIGSDKPAIMDYNYDSEYQEEPDFIPLGLEQQIGLIYTHDDLFADNMLGYINNMLQESYAVSPSSVRYLSPTTEQLFVPRDYPERFFRWSERLFDFSKQIP